MPTVFFGSFNAGFRGTPPRMAPGDFDIWGRWWPKVREGTVSLLFDVGLGDGIPLDPSTDTGAALIPPFDFRALATARVGSPERLAFMHLRNTQKRADVIIERDTEVWIAELRFNAQASAIGRLLMYGRLWGLDPVFTKPVVLYLITDREDPDVKASAEELGIVYVVA